MNSEGKVSSRKWNGLRSEQDYLENSPKKTRPMDQLQEASIEHSPQGRRRSLSLYERNMEWKRKRDEQMAVQAEEKEEREMAECKWQRSKQQRRASSSTYQRHKEWQASVDRKNKQRKAEQSARQSKELKFRPRTHASKSTLQFSAFLERN